MDDHPTHDTYALSRQGLRSSFLYICLYACMGSRHVSICSYVLSLSRVSPNYGWPVRFLPANSCASSAIHANPLRWSPALGATECYGFRFGQSVFLPPRHFYFVRGLQPESGVSVPSTDAQDLTVCRTFSNPLVELVYLYRKQKNIIPPNRPKSYDLIRTCPDSQLTQHN